MPIQLRRSLITSAILVGSTLSGPALAQVSTAGSTTQPSLGWLCPGGEIVEGQNGEDCARADTLESLIADFERAEMMNDPITAGERGDRTALRKLPDASLAAQQAADARLEAFIRRHRALRRSGGLADLSDEDRLNYDLLGFVLDQRKRLVPFDQARIPFTNDSGFFNAMIYLARQTRFERAEDYEAYAARLTQLPRYLSQNKENMRRGMADNFMAAKQILPGVIEITRTLAETDWAEHPLYQPFADMPDQIDAEDQTRLRALGEAAMKSSVIPAYTRLLSFMEDEYLPKARAQAGIGATEAGRDYYRALVKHFTTLDITPDEVHELGLSEVARIRAEMDEVIEDVGFEGTFAEFLNFLRTDPQFYAKSEKELLMYASWLAKKIDGQMPAFFGTLPRLSYGVIKVPDSIAKSYTTGRYWGGSPESGRAGNYVVNTYDLKQRPLYNLPALTAHEGVPGHHHQIALGQELEDLPDFRKSLYPTAFGEGWGLYSEKLAAEMGLYETPYDRFGQLSYEMWRACRLVVDTGMHWKGWTREQAEACFLENSALSTSNIRTEVDRYISWPGQALGYKIGELKILELRAKAEAALGDAFDIRTFHDAVLLQGGLPLSVLEVQIDRYIAQARRDAAEQAQATGFPTGEDF